MAQNTWHRTRGAAAEGTIDARTTRHSGYLVGGKFLDFAAGHFAHLRHHNWVTSGPGYAILAVLGIYVVASIVNLYIPRVAIDHKPLSRNPAFLLREFNHCFWLLWKDPLGQVSLAVTTLFWGSGATLRLIVLTWAAVAGACAPGLPDAGVTS